MIFWLLQLRTIKSCSHSEAAVAVHGQCPLGKHVLLIWEAGGRRHTTAAVGVQGYVGFANRKSIFRFSDFILGDNTEFIQSIKGERAVAAQGAAREWCLSQSSAPRDICCSPVTAHCSPLLSYLFHHLDHS